MTEHRNALGLKPVPLKRTGFRPGTQGFTAEHDLLEDIRAPRVGNSGSLDGIGAVTELLPAPGRETWDARRWPHCLP